MIKNNITRMLKAREIAFTVYELPQEKLSALDTAWFLDVPPDQVFKTIVVKRRGSGKHILAVIPATKQVNLKLVAKVLKEKKVLLTTQEEAETLTGLKSGGISPLALINHGFQVIIDKSAHSQSQIHISGGQRGLNIRLSPIELVKLTSAMIARITT